MHAQATLVSGPVTVIIAGSLTCRLAEALTGNGGAVAVTEGTYEPETTNYRGAFPFGWCLNHGSGPCAQFFGGQTSSSSHALMWQWSGGGGVTNGIGGFNGDLDQIDSARMG